MQFRSKNISDHQKNKNQTMQLLIDAVGLIIKNKGYRGLGLNAIAKEAGVSKILVYRYFGGVNELIEAYVLQNDYWIAKSGEVTEQTQNPTDKEALKKMVSDLLKGHFDYFNNHEEMRTIILWEITERTNLLNSISHLREEMGKLLLDKAMPFFCDSDKSIKGVTALLVSAIYYMILHAKSNESTICGIDVNSLEGQKEILKTIDQIIDWTFDL